MTTQENTSAEDAEEYAERRREVLGAPLRLTSPPSALVFTASALDIKARYIPR